MAQLLMLAARQRPQVAMADMVVMEAMVGTAAMLWEAMRLAEMVAMLKAELLVSFYFGRLSLAVLDKVLGVLRQETEPEL